MPQQRDYLVVGNDVDAIPTAPSLNVSPTHRQNSRLNGFPGTGKLTILKQAKELLPADTTILLDNHLLIDPVIAVIPGRSNEHHELHRRLRASIFKKLGERAQEGYVILMTACLAEDNVRDTAFLKEHLGMVRGTDVPIIWVNAHCDQAALEQRLRSPERCQGAKTKLTDVCVLQDLRREHRLIEPSKSADGSAKLVVETLDASGPVELSVSRLMTRTENTDGVERRGETGGMQTQYMVPGADRAGTQGYERIQRKTGRAESRSHSSTEGTQHTEVTEWR